MTNIRVAYDSVTGKASVCFGQEEITAAENRICTFLSSSGFHNCLHPFRKRYVIWKGLLHELIDEVNDEELQIVFEGQASDYRLVEEAFRRSADAAEEQGYTNKWELSYAGDLGMESAVETLLELAKSLREVCESRAELGTVDHFILQMKKSPGGVDCGTLRDILAGHIQKWGTSGSPYSQEKITYLEMMLGRLDEAEGYLTKRAKRGGA